MSKDLEQKQFELKSIQNLLGLHSGGLSFLEKLEFNEINELRNQIIIFMQDGQKEVWAPIAKVSKFLPNFLNAKATEEILGAKIAANLSYHLPASDALGIAGHFSIKFFADVLENLVPEKIEDMIKQSPHDLMRRAVNELLKRQNHFLIGSLIDYTPIESVEKIARGIENMEDLILVTSNARDKKRVLKLFERFEETKIVAVVKAGLQEKLRDSFRMIYEQADEDLINKTKNILTSRDAEILSKFTELLKTPA
jgi:hypothetical protein